MICNSVDFRNCFKILICIGFHTYIIIIQKLFDDKFFFLISKRCNFIVFRKIYRKFDTFFRDIQIYVQQFNIIVIITFYMHYIMNIMKARNYECEN